MSDHRPRSGLQLSVRSLYRTLYLFVMLTRAVASLPQTANDNSAATTTSHIALIPSAPRPTSLIPSEPFRVQSSTSLSTGVIPSQPPPPVLGPSPPPTFTLSSHAEAPSAPPSSTNLQPGGIIPSKPPPIPIPPSANSPSNSNTITSTTKSQPTGTSYPNVTATGAVPSYQSTDQGLKPIPAPTSDPGSPDGHHEIPEPNLTGPCRNCNPDQQTQADGWNDRSATTSHVIAEPQESPSPTKGPPSQATITVGSSTVTIKPVPTGQTDSNVGDSGEGGGGGGNGGGSNSNGGNSNGGNSGGGNSGGGNSGGGNSGGGNSGGGNSGGGNSGGGNSGGGNSGGGNSGGGNSGGGNGGESENSNPNDTKFIIGGSMTVQAGQTITLENTPVIIQTTAGRTEVIVGGTTTIPFERSAQALITDPPLAPLPVTVGSQTFTPIIDTNKKSDDQTPTGYLIQGQTLVPGGPPVTVQGTVYSLPATPTAIVVNGQSTTITPDYGAVISTTTIPLLTLFQSTYTANAAGNYVIAPGTTLRPGGEVITVSGSVISLKPGNTEIVVQGSTSRMVPATTVVTVTRSGGSGGGAGRNGGNTSPSGTAAQMLPYPAGVGRTAGLDWRLDGSLEGAAILGALAVGWLAVWL